MPLRAASDKALIRKLEARLLAVRDAAALQAKVSDLHSQLDAARHSLTEAQARARTAEEAATHQAAEAALLRRGIELAAEQLTQSVGAEVPTTLLMAVARVRAGLPLCSGCCSCSLSVHIAEASNQYISWPVTSLCQPACRARRRP